MNDNDTFRDHDKFAAALCTLFDFDEANGGTKGCSDRDEVVHRIGEALVSNRRRYRDGVDVFTLARAMLVTYEATLARIASREGAK